MSSITSMGLMNCIWLGWNTRAAHVRIHRPRLHHPGGRLLIEQHPEEGHEGQQQRGHPEHRLHALHRLRRVLRLRPVQPGAARDARSPGRARRSTLKNECGFGPVGGTMHVVLAAGPEDDRRDEHQDARDAERHRRPELRRISGINSDAKNEPKLMIQ